MMILSPALTKWVREERPLAFAKKEMVVVVAVNEIVEIIDFAQKGDHLDRVAKLFAAFADHRLLWRFAFVDSAPWRLVIIEMPEHIVALQEVNRIVSFPSVTMARAISRT